MTPDARAFLDRVRDAENPTAEDQARVLAAVRVAVAAGALAGAFAALSKMSRGLVASSTPKLAGLSIAVCLAGAFSAVPSSTPRARLPSLAAATPAPSLGTERAGESITAISEPALEPPADSIAPATSPVVPSRVPRSPERRSETKRDLPSLREELHLLDRVRTALRAGDGATALRLLDEHRTSDRQLEAERDAARVLAICATRPAPEAAEAAATFAARHPGSVHRAAIAGACDARDAAER